MSSLKPVDDPCFLSVFLTEELYVPQDEVTSANNITKPDTEAETGTSTKADDSAKPITEDTKPPKEDSAAQQVELPSAPADLVFGKNGKGLLILVDAPGEKVMSKTEGKLLKDILQSINYSFEDVAILNVARCEHPHYFNCLQEINFKHLISFGVKTNAIIQLDALEPFTKRETDTKVFIMADKLSAIEGNRQAKMALWNLLKQYFV